MDWDLTFNAKLIKENLYSVDEVNNWVYKNTGYPFFLYERKLYMTFKDGPGLTDYVFSNGRIIIPNEVSSKIGMAILTGRLKCKPGRRKWNSYEIDIEDNPNDRDSINVCIMDKTGKHVCNLYTKKPKKQGDGE